MVKTKFSVFGIFSFINAAASRLIRWFCLKKIICDSEIIPNLMKDLLEAHFRIFSQNKCNQNSTLNLNAQKWPDIFLILVAYFLQFYFLGIKSEMNTV